MKISSCCMGILLLSAAGAASAQINLYENDNFNGRN
jgi:hypothetical protein